MLGGRARQRIGRWIGVDGAPRVRARLFLKADCGLCEEAIALLRPFERRGHLALELVDIAANPELFRRYCFAIPVLAIEGGPTLEWPFDRAALRKVLG
jgi:hypothetical protein